MARLSVTARRVVLLGVASSGKTALGIAIGRAKAEQFDRNAMYLDAQALDAAKADRDGEAALLAVRASEVPILVLDELGAEPGRSSAVALLLHERHAEQRQTIVATGLTPAEIRERYSDGVCRRLFEGAAVIRCDREEQPTPKSPIERVPLPERRMVISISGPSVPAPSEFKRALASIGAGPIDPRARFRAKAHAFLNRRAS
jgi:hypothetical protein